MAQPPAYRPAQRWHLATVIIAMIALVLQLILVLSGASVLVAEERQSLGARLFHFICYFTIQANVLVVISAVFLIRKINYDQLWWRVLRAAAMIGITVTGLVHWFLLRPLLHLEGASFVADKLLHIVVPVMAMIGWLLFGPRRRITLATLRGSLIWPVLWIVCTLVHGAITGWYPYPFLDAGIIGAGPVILAVVGIAALFVGLGALLFLGDRWLPTGRFDEPVVDVDDDDQSVRWAG